MVEALDIIIEDVLKEDFVKGKANHRKNRMCCPILNKKIEVEEGK